MEWTEVVLSGMEWTGMVWSGLGWHGVALNDREALNGEYEESGHGCYKCKLLTLVNHCWTPL